MMKFLAFKVLSGEMDFIRYEVFVGGHGHCLCDGMFGVCKCYYRKCRVISFDELLETVRKCSSMQSFEKTDETSLRLWGDELNKFFSTIPNITQYWVFEFERVEDGVMVRMKRRRSDERSVDINLLKAEFRRTPNLVTTHLLPLVSRRLPQQPIKGMTAINWSKVKKSLLQMVPPEYQSELVPPDHVMLGTEVGAARRQRERAAAARGASRSTGAQMEQVVAAAAAGRSIPRRERRPSRRARDEE